MLQPNLKKNKNWRLCSEPEKDYGKLLPDLRQLKKLPTLADVLGHYHYLG